MKLSKRLETIASFVQEGSIVADIGTDHGYIPIHLVKNGICSHAYAMDVRKGPLERAGAHVKEWGLEDKITLRLSDGLVKLAPGEADTVVIAGMGGELINRILENGRHVWESVSRWILSPQSELGEVRRYLEHWGFVILKESMVEEDGKFYTIMEAGRGCMKLSKACYYEYGVDLIRKQDPVLRVYLEKEEKVLSSILKGLKAQDTPGARNRQQELEKKMKVLKEAQHEMQ